MLDIHGLQILVFTLVASTSIAVLFGDSWWKVNECFFICKFLSNSLIYEETQSRQVV